jgi:hypothetical protein
MYGWSRVLSCDPERSEGLTVDYRIPRQLENYMVPSALKDDASV